MKKPPNLHTETGTGTVVAVMAVTRLQPDPAAAAVQILIIILGILDQWRCGHRFILLSPAAAKEHHRRQCQHRTMQLLIHSRRRWCLFDAQTWTGGDWDWLELKRVAYW